MSAAWKNALDGLQGLASIKGPISVDKSVPVSLQGDKTPVGEGLVWTPDQRQVMDDRHSRIQVCALAGSGKTKVIGAYARLRPRARLAYVTFSAALARQAKAMLPDHLRAKTFHGLAFPRFGERLAHRFSRTWHVGDLNTILKLGLPPAAELRWREVLLKTLEGFMASASPLVMPEHIDRSNWYLSRSAGDPVPHEDTSVVAQAEQLWLALIDLAAPWPVTHDVYLKLWCLAEVQMSGDGILVDEDQDLTPALHAWLEQQGGIQVRVGDPYQAIYGFRGAIGQQRLSGASCHALPQSFRFGAAIAGAANGLLARLGDDRLIGAGPEGEVHDHWVSRPGTMLLARTHAGLLDAALDAVDQGMTLAHVVQVPQQILAVLALREGKRESICDPWVAGFDDFESFEAAVSQTGQTAWRSAAALVRKRGARLHDQMARLQGARDPLGWQMSTVHSVKGQTFEHVALADDLILMDPVSSEGQEEAHVAYVAMTRARQSLAFHPQLAASFKQWQQGRKEKPIAALDDGF